MFTFTTGQDHFDGTAYNDIFSGFVGNDNGGNDISTVQVWDAVNGGAGVNTLSLLVNQDYMIDPTMTNVENIAVRTVNGATAFIDFTNIHGVNTLEIRDSNSDWGHMHGWNVSDKITTYKFTNVARQNDSLLNQTQFNNDVFTGIADAINVVLANAGNTENDEWANLHLYNQAGNSVIEVMNVESKGSDNRLSYLDGQEYYSFSVLNTVNVTGAAALNLSIYHQDSLTTIDAADFDAGLTFSANGLSAKDMTITTGAGKDEIDLSLSTHNNTVSTGAGDDVVKMGDNLAAGDLLDGGAGTDALSMTSAAAVAASLLTGKALFSNFETLGLVDYLIGAVDMAKLDGMQNLSLMNSHGLASVAGLTSGANITETGNAQDYLTANIAGTGTTDTLNVNLKSADAIQEKIALTGVETLNIVSTDTDTSSHTNWFYYDTPNATSITVSGNAGVLFNSANVDSGAKLTSFDASGVSGAAADAATVCILFFMSDNGTTTATVNITGSSGNDTLLGNAAMDVITGGAGNDVLASQEGNDTLNGGAGDDILQGGAGKDLLTGGDGKDTFQYTVPATHSNGTNVDTITDFVSGTDKIVTFPTVIYVGGANGYGAVLTSLTGVAYQGVLDTSTSTLYIDVNGELFLTPTTW